jgi:hypothetical protein
MPITVHAYTSIADEDIRNQLERLYDTSPEFGDGQDAIDQLEQNLAQYTLLYTAEFNSKLLVQFGVRGVGMNVPCIYRGTPCQPWTRGCRATG